MSLVPSDRQQRRPGNGTSTNPNANTNQESTNNDDEDDAEKETSMRKLNRLIERQQGTATGSRHGQGPHHQTPLSLLPVEEEEEKEEEPQSEQPNNHYRSHNAPSSVQRPGVQQQADNAWASLNQFSFGGDVGSLHVTLPGDPGRRRDRNEVRRTAAEEERIQEVQDEDEEEEDVGEREKEREREKEKEKEEEPKHKGSKGDKETQGSRFDKLCLDWKRWLRNMAMVVAGCLFITSLWVTFCRQPATSNSPPDGLKFAERLKSSHTRHQHNITTDPWIFHHATEMSDLLVHSHHHFKGINQTKSDDLLLLSEKITPVADQERKMRTSCSQKLVHHKAKLVAILTDLQSWSLQRQVQGQLQQQRPGREWIDLLDWNTLRLRWNEMWWGSSVRAAQRRAETRARAMHRNLAKWIKDAKGDTEESKPLDIQGASEFLEKMKEVACNDRKDGDKRSEVLLLLDSSSSSDGKGGNDEEAHAVSAALLVYFASRDSLRFFCEYRSLADLTINSVSASLDDIAELYSTHNNSLEELDDMMNMLKLNKTQGEGDGDGGELLDEETLARTTAELDGKLLGIAERLLEEMDRTLGLFESGEDMRRDKDKRGMGGCERNGCRDGKTGGRMK